MFKIDNQLIKDRLSGVSFSFYTKAEIKSLSVVEVTNTQTFDHLANPHTNGLHDKRMGVSPFDRSSSCLTCGLTSNYCPGHHGHIELVAPIYNPFMIKDLYRLMKAKCFSCNRLRINETKIEVLTNALKFVKTGDIMSSQKVRNQLLSLARETISLKTNDAEDTKKAAKIAKTLNYMMGSDNRSRQFTNDDIKEQLNHISRKHNIEREKFEYEIMEMLADIEENKNPEETNKIERSGQTSIMQKFQLDIIKEMWSSVVTTKCPHCKQNSPAFRKDGYTKMFVKPLTGKGKGSQVQRKRLGTGVSEDNQTVASTKHGSRKASTTIIDDEESEVSAEEEPGMDIDDDKDEEYKEGGQQKYISPSEVKSHIEKLWAKEGNILNLIYGKFEPAGDSQPFEVTSLGSQIFFIDQVLVPPTRFRPESEGSLGGGGGGGGGGAYLHTHSAMLLKILTTSEAMREALLAQGQALADQVSGTGKLGYTTQKWIQLQEAVNCFMDSSMASKTADKETHGVRQLLEKKEGMFRMKMMGKRVNYGGRSVISPDPYITTDQIGVPLFMAKKLTFPESVSGFNVDRLRQLVRNGTQTHPGANMIEDEDSGQQVHLAPLDAEQRDGLAKLLTVGRKVVYRHLAHGDPLLVNRQPTLHKPSIMAHRCRVLPKEQTIRMHYANCNTYNADFDGDEMNLHLPQSYQAFSEAYNLMATHRQYCVPTSGKPIRGLIQDSVVAGVFMTSKDMFLDKEQYNQLVYVGLRELIEMDKIPKIETLQPAMFKPKPLWTGKQVISTLLKNIVNNEKEYKRHNLTGLNASFKAKLAPGFWGPLGTEEGDVLFRDNEHLRGTLDKSAFGATEFGLVHAFCEVYGSEKAGELLTALARVFTVFLQTHGFTCGLDDLMVDKQFNKQRRLAIETGHIEGVKAAAEFCGLKGYEPKELNYSNRVVFQSEKHFDADFDKLTKMALPKNPFKNKQCIQADDELRNALEQKMSNAGTDLGMLDAELDSVMQGRMNDATSKVLKAIIPGGLIKKFPANNLSAMVLTGAKGGVVNQTQISALLGQQSLEGRRVPKMQNGKTLPCFLPYDPNPRSNGYISDRFISGLRPQDFYFHCMAGREGLIDTAVKTSRSGYLQRCLIKQLESLVVSYDMTVRDNDGSVVQFMYGEDGIDVLNTKYLDKYTFLEQNFNSLVKSGSDIVKRTDAETVKNHKKASKRVAKMLKKANPAMSNREALNESSDPLLNLFHPQKYFGCISEKASQGLEKYSKTECQSVKLEGDRSNALKRKYAPVQPETFQQGYYMKYMKSLVNPGENVGTIAAQSVGEPSTQMTLNTFHLAGHGAGNMTLGIPRLKEILMTTPYNIKTPIMKLFFRKDVAVNLAECQKFANKFNRLKLVDIVKEVQVTQSIKPSSNGGFGRVYRISLAYDNLADLSANLGLDQEKLGQLFSDHFVPRLMAEAFKQLKKSEDSAGEAGAAAAGNKEISSAARRIGAEKAQPGTADQGENIEADALLEEDQAIKARSGAGKAGGKSQEQAAGLDDDDVLSEHEAELLNEINTEMDGNVKISKDVRGYDDQDQDAKQDDDSCSLGSQTAGAKTKKEAGVDKYTKPLREAHSRYLQYLRGIEVDKEANVFTVNIALPIEFKKVLMLTLAEQTLGQVVVRQVPHIEKCTLIKPKKEGDEAYLVVQGINFDAFIKHQSILDVNRIETNHSYALRAKYGVEAMRANIVKEILMVFGVYGISVDYRHLSLIGDFMTFNGDYRAFNRIGMEESSSPFLKMSYETTMKYLVSASQALERDDMSAPSSAVVLGQLPRLGTGMFDVIHDRV